MIGVSGICTFPSRPFVNSLIFIALLCLAQFVAIPKQSKANLIPGNSKSLHTNSNTEKLTGADVNIYRFPLRPTSRARAASGMGELFISWSPFGVSVTPDGFLDYVLTVTIKGLPPVATLGGKAYVAWITTPELDRMEKLGVLEESGKLTSHVSSMNKFILLITAEKSTEVSKRSGPILIRGISPSGLLQNFDSHELFNNMPH